MHPTGRAPPTFRRVGLHLVLNFVGQNQRIWWTECRDAISTMPGALPVWNAKPRPAGAN